MLKACAVGIVKSVFSRFYSNTTAEVKYKSKDVQPGKPLKLRFVIHDSEESLRALVCWWLPPIHNHLLWSLLS